MLDWAPISEAELRHMIGSAEGCMRPRRLRLWEAIRIAPEKWREDGYGTEGGGFWAVAVVGRQVLWYNDIEEGFNWSPYAVAGEIGVYICDQDTLEMALRRLEARIAVARDPVPRRGAPLALEGRSTMPSPCALDPNDPNTIAGVA